MFDYLIVGAGFSGSVLAERLASTGARVCIADRRPHIGGNAYDVFDDHGILVHQYGPHIFHTNSARVYISTCLASRLGARTSIACWRSWARSVFRSRSTWTL